MARPPVRSALCPVRADDRAAVPARSRRAPALFAAPEFLRWLSPSRLRAAAPHGIPAELRRNAPVPPSDSAAQVLVAAALQRAPRRLAAVALAVPAAAQPAGCEPSADRPRSSPVDRPRGRACCGRL